MALALVPLQPPDRFEPIRALVLDAVSSPLSRAMYARALDDFFDWQGATGHGFTRAAVQAHRAHLEGQGYAPASVNQRMSAIRKLAQEAAANGLVSFELANSIQEVPGVKQRGTRMGNWLTRQQTQALLDAPSPHTLKGVRDRAALALLIGCGLRRSEAVAVTVEHIQQREGRWLIVDLGGKGGRIRSVPVPSGVKVRIDQWTQAAGIVSGRILRSLNRGVLGERMSGQAILDLVAEYAHIKPHDLRRTCAKLCRKAGGELEQIQMLLGHASIATTERYLGSEQDIEHAPNDRMHLRFS